MKRVIAAGTIAALTLVLAGLAGASHAWGPYHWERSANPLVVPLGDNLSSDWTAHLATASADWSASSVLDAPVVAGASSKKRCAPTAGRGEICNDRYGYNGWLGVAQIWLSGDHITQGIVKLNDSYFGSPPYNTTPWKNLVMCQEVGHVFGLDHQDEDFENTPLGTCMDYSNDPVPNQHPNRHDYEQLEAIYAHLDGSSGGGGPPPCRGKGCNGKGNNGAGPPERVRDDVWVEDLGNGNRRVTHVFWVDPGKPHGFPAGLDS